MGKIMKNFFQFRKIRPMISSGSPFLYFQKYRQAVCTNAQTNTHFCLYQGEEKKCSSRVRDGVHLEFFDSAYCYRQTNRHTDAWMSFQVEGSYRNPKTNLM